MEQQEKYLPVAAGNDRSLFFDKDRFEHAQRVARVFAESDLVPKHFQGKIANCVIALNYAQRMGLDPFMVFQNLYIVYGRPGLESKLVIALINQSGKYSTPLQFDFDGQGDDYGCTAHATDARSKKEVFGPKITWKIVKGEKWDTKEGSKWKTMPDVMFRYRAASWFCNVNCPEVKLGMPTVDELNDVVDLEKTPNGHYDIAAEKTAEKLADLKDRLGVKDPEPANPVPPPEPEKPSRKPRSDKGTTSKPAQEQLPADDPPPEAATETALNPEAAELEAARAELNHVWESEPGYLMQAQRNLQMAVGRSLPPTLDGCRVLIEEIARLRVERGKQ
jgi:hypothetical protein